MSSIKFVFFDIDDTLFDFKRSEATALSETLTELGISPTEETVSLYSRINQGQWEALERGEVSRDVLLVRRYELLFEALGIARDPRKAQKIYEKRLSETYYYMPYAEKLLESLSGRFQIYLASNGTAVVQNGRIALSGIGRFADGIFISELVGHNKPSREFFDTCFSQIKDFNNNEAIIIGDSLTSDILGGINAGIKTCLFNPQNKPCRPDIIPDYEVSSLEEIPALLMRI